MAERIFGATRFGLVSKKLKPRILPLWTRNSRPGIFVRKFVNRQQYWTPLALDVVSLDTTEVNNICLRWDFTQNTLALRINANANANANVKFLPCVLRLRSNC